MARYSKRKKGMSPTIKKRVLAAVRRALGGAKKKSRKRRY